MSIAVLTQVYDEMRRLAIAGSGVAGGDFRLKKLIPPLEKAGEKAPVFAKVAQAAQAVVNSNEKTASAALLDLAAVVNAILYTQGATGIAGDLQPIETIDLGTRQTQASARMLKPLLEALSTTGSGRMEIIKDAFERGVFADLRLVQPALKALDDVYSEIGDFVAEKVLPLYGTAILPELRRQFDIKGKSGHIPRLRLMHALDPAGTRELVKQTLDEGSKELRVVAIECLGDSEEDLAFLLEQSKAKAKDVRAAALGALTKLNAAAALETVQKAATGGNLASLVDGLRESRNPVLLAFVLTEADQQLTALLKLKDKKEQSAAVSRLLLWLQCLYGREDSGTEALLLKCFDRAGDLETIKSEPSGADVNQIVAGLMVHASPGSRGKLIAAHETLSGAMLSYAFHAARRTVSPAKLFEMFSSCLVAQPEKKSKKNANAFARLEAVRGALTGNDDHLDYYDWRFRRRFYERPDARPKPPDLDPRWLDAAVQGSQLDVVLHLARPGHTAANRFLSEQYAAKGQKYNQVEILQTMVRVQHPAATDTVIEVLQKTAKGPGDAYISYWIGHLIVDLPSEAAPRIEALLPTLPEAVVDRLMGFVLELKSKANAATPAT